MIRQYASIQFLQPIRAMVVLSAADKPPSQPPEGFEALFSGKDLNNWRGQIAEDPRDIAKIRICRQ